MLIIEPEALIPTEGEKNHKKGGLNYVFQNFFFFVQELFSGSESERGSESD